MKKFTIFIKGSEKTVEFDESVIVTNNLSYLLVKKATIFWEYNNIQDNEAIVGIGGSDTLYGEGFYTFEEIKSQLLSYAVDTQIYSWNNKVLLTSPVQEVTLLKFGELLGFDSGTVINAGGVISPRPINILNGLKYICVSCDIVDRTENFHNDKRSSIVTTLPISVNVPERGSTISYFDIESKVKINKGVINKIQFKVTDQDNKSINVGAVLLECYIM